MNKHNILHHIPKTKEGTYYTIDFPMPHGMEIVTVAYSYKRFRGKSLRLSKMVNIVDIGLIDADNRFIGWSGSAKSSVFTGQYTATQGYAMVPLKPGVWKIIVGAYKIPDEGLDVSYEISYKKSEARWFAGDLHMHSNASDGKHDIFTLTQMASKKKLDFIAVSNHNNYSENMHLPVIPGLTLIPAVEWTHYLGHMNFFGVKAPFINSFIANNEEEMRNLVSDAKSLGAKISVNHPKCNICPYLWKSDDVFDIIEVWNGPMRKVNMDAIKWWHEMLLSGKKIPIIGGSDFHKKHHIVRMANPVTSVYADSPSKEDILNAISNGHSYITSSVKGVSLKLSYNEAMMGDTAKYQSEQKISVSADNLKAGISVRLVSNHGTISEWKHFKKGKLKAEIHIPEKCSFVYLIAQRNILGQVFCRAISNPIYFE
ncbi:MAG: CehA/McbA family metallohydrolase [Clostridia bacterium]|nr:CehA/McbA family metallohydrolase [Clostridia bacterium]